MSELSTDQMLSGGATAGEPLPAESAYDQVPYLSRPYPQSHPNRMAVLARLFGMEPPAIETCRVLELGCAAGGNIVPMALALPGARFVGIDVSARELADGQRTISALNLPNIELKHMDILDIDEGFGTFDYIICHGVYSWVPPAVRDKILQVCSAHLADNGVAFVSYNTYPGWHFRNLVRDMMFYHGRDDADPLRRARRGREMLDLLRKIVPADKSPYGAILKGEADILRHVEDWYLCHDHLADCNQPVRFHEFARAAGGVGLQFLAEAHIAAMTPRGLSAEAREALGQWADDIMAQQQYLDFIRATPFRQTLLCHQNVPLRRQVDPLAIEPLHVAARATPDPAEFDLHAATPVTFSGPGGKLATNRPLMKAAMLHLTQNWPGAVPFATLCAAARQKLDPSPVHSADEVQADRQTLREIVLKGYWTSNLLELHACPPVVCRLVSERPLASPLARLQAAEGAVVTTLRHESYRTTELERSLLPHLDGRHERPALLEVLAGLVRNGTLVLRQEDGEPADPARAAPLLAQSLDKTLKDLAAQALLTA